MRRDLTRTEITAMRRAVQVIEELKFPDQNIGVAVRTATDDHGQILVRISRSKKLLHDE